MDFVFSPSLKLANLPTPVEHMRAVPELPDLPNVYIKRDDLTGSELSGNKVRKLEFALAEAVAADARAVVTCGGIQSNHARATAVAAARLGLRPVLVLRGAAPEESDGNVLLDRLAGAEIRFITQDEWPRVNETMAEIAAELGASGEKAYVIPEGASYPPGVFGYIRAAQEIAEAEKALGIEFDAIVTAVGSGGTSAGLIYGKRIFGLKANILGDKRPRHAGVFRVAHRGDLGSVRREIRKALSRSRVVQSDSPGRSRDRGGLRRPGVRGADRRRARAHPHLRAASRDLLRSGIHGQGDARPRRRGGEGPLEKIGQRSLRSHGRHILSLPLEKGSRAARPDRLKRESRVFLIPLTPRIRAHNVI